MSRLTTPNVPQQRTLVAVAIVVIMLLSALAPFVGVAAGQAANATNTTSNETVSIPELKNPSTPVPPASVPGENSSNKSSDGKQKGKKGNKSDSPAGMIGLNETWGEFVNATHNPGGGKGGGGKKGGDGGGGILDAAGDAVSWGWDAIASVGDTLAMSFDEGVGKMVKAFFSGAQAFFSWMMGFFIRQAMGILSKPLEMAINAMTMTPHANNVGSYYTPPTNSFKPLYKTFTTTGQAAAWLVWLVSLVALIGFGNYLGVGMMDKATEKQAAVGLALGIFFLSDFSWVVTNVFLHTLDIIGQAVTVDIKTSLAKAGFSGMMLILVAILVYFEAFAAIALLAVAAFRIEFIMALTPFIGALIIGRVSPIKGLSSLSGFVLELWAILAVSGVPAAFLLDAAFSMARMALAGKLSTLGTMMAVPMVLGGIIGAALMPFLLLKGRNKIFSGSLGISGVSSDKVTNKMSEYREKAARPNRFQRGVRGKEPVTDGGTRSHRAGTATRNAPGKAKETAKSARSAASTTREKASREYAQKRAREMKERITRRTGNSGTQTSDTSTEGVNSDSWTTMNDKLNQNSSSDD